MKTKSTFLALLFLTLTFTSNAQLGIRAGLNMANEIHSFSSSDIASAFKSDNLTGYHIGLVYQFNPKVSGFGLELGALFTQKGSVFKMDYSTNSLIKGYHEINYLEVPINLRYRLSFGGVVGVFGSAGIYGGYVLKGKTVYEGDDALPSQNDTFDSFMDKIDYGYNFGFGVELIRKIQIGVNWSQALQKKDASRGIINKIDGIIPNVEAKNTPRAFSVSLTYLF